ncbi:MAG: tail fiber protein [Chitinophaga sp.]|uniref:phage tail protein n=1 Tax=Chitinophaga sp. TaxID=1869181 RepID=UPI0025BD1A23|nr:tail fiber protein [Chitinophaga sp.]MBV8255975.1 tail fiber protein [Chitinophaga sp.]
MDYYIGALLLFAGDFAIRNFALCFGQLMSIQQNTALFAILGNTYGGNGTNTFGLPDLRGRMPIGTSQGPGLSNIVLGQLSGAENCTLTINNLPTHTHTIDASTMKVTPGATAQLATTYIPSNTVVPAMLPKLGGGPAAVNINGYGVPDGTTTLAPSAVSGTITAAVTGNNQSFPIRNPYLGMNYQICLFGIFPTRN